MNKYQLFLALAYAARQALQQHVAVVVKGWKTLGIGQDSRTGASGAGTAVATALQNLASTVRLDDCDIFVTYVPTELCLGMARICRIRSVIVIQGGQLLRFKPGDDVGLGGFASASISPAELNQVKIKAKNTAPQIAKNIPNVATSATPEADAFAWWQQASGNAQTWYDAPATEAVNGFDNAPSFSKVYPPELPLVPNQTGPTMPRKQDLRDTIFMLTAYAIAAITWDRTDDWKGNKVACILVDAHDRIVSWSINLREGENVTWHGETVTLRRYLAQNRRTTMDAGYRLYTTLKPCYMCAGMVAQVAPSLTIIYGQNDPEILNSTLDRNPGPYPQSASKALHTPDETFPELMQRLLTAVGGTAIPFLETLSPADFNTSFGRAFRWFKAILSAARNQYALADEVHSGSLAYLDLAVPDKREIAANIWVLYQAMQLLETIDTRIKAGNI
jgi:tRNA(Arg) A34 adenosine deaminase TadA